MMFRCIVIYSQFLFAVLVPFILKILLCFLGVYRSSLAVLTGGWVQEWYLLTSLQVAGQWGPHLCILTLRPSVPSWLQSPDHAAHTLHPLYLTQGLLYPTCGYHSCWEPSPSEQPSGAPVTWPWPFPSPTSVCPGFLPSLLCFQPVTLPPTHWENRMYLAAAPLLHFHPDDTPLPFRPSPVPSSWFQQRRRPPGLCRVCLSPPCPRPQGFCAGTLGFVSHLLSMFPPVHK